MISPNVSNKNDSIRDLLQIEDSVLFSVHDHRSETFVARIEYSEIFDGK